FRRLVRFNIKAGAHGFWIAGGAGESVLLDDEENHRIAEIAVEECRDKAVTIMHVGAPTTKRAADMAEHAAKAGVDAICCVPPFFYHPRDHEVAEHYRVVGEAADLPLFVYNLPGATGIEITLPLMEEIQSAVPQLEGLKHSAINFRNVWKFSRMGLSCFIGSAALFLPALTVGACGCVDGPPSLAPDLWVRIWEGYHNGGLKAAEEAQDIAAQFYNVFEKATYLATMKTLLSKKLGVDFGDPRPPQLPMTDELQAFVIDEANRLGLMDLPS
ncbi:MAG TPA: hypothetical protein DIU35_02830, partial [Candidatus Latescibacteria bacterium]|nr:hypothetical protein [Candidatus Latescibacterota bacterium]